MATLQSPGVSVTVVDESFYTPAAPGTIPLIFVASAQDKTNPSGNIAPGTTAANAGKLYYITSQRDLTDTFGVPTFYTDANGNPIHGGELNEYGLQAAYSLLGVSSAAFVVRADVDLAALTPNASAPDGNPTNGSYWLDTTNTTWGIFEWDAKKGVFVNKLPLVIHDGNKATSTVSGLGVTPDPAVGLIGSYAFVVTSNNANTVWYKNTDANWVLVGSVNDTSFASNASSDTFNSTVWSTSWPTVLGTNSPNNGVVSVSGTLTINGNTVAVSAGDSVADIATAVNAALRTDGIGAKVVKGALALYADANAASDGTNADGAITIASTATSLLNQLGLTTGTTAGPTVTIAPHTQHPNYGTKPSGSVYIKTTSPNAGQIWTVKQWSESTQQFNFVKAPVYPTTAAATYNLDKVGGGQFIATGNVFVESNVDHGGNQYVNGDKYPVLAEFVVKERVAVAPTRVTSSVPVSPITVTTGTFVVEVTEAGSAGFTNTTTVNVSAGTVNEVVKAINNSGVPNLSAALNANGTVSIEHATGGEVRFTDTDGILADALFVPNTTANLYNAGEYDAADFIASNWKPMSYTSSPVPISSEPANGQLWYYSVIDQVDIMYHDGQGWVGYRNAFPDTDPNGPIVSASKPTTQSDGVTTLKQGDIWISTANGVDNFGKEIYVYDFNSLSWVQQDVTDQTSPNGWVFADARWATSGQAVAASPINELLLSDYLDPDAPDPAEYPEGMRLWNLRRSGYNVKKYVTGHIDINANNGINIRYTENMDDYNPNRWVSVSPNNEDGSGTFGRHAQRAFVVAALKAMIDSNTAVRDTDSLFFNLLATPGYPEAIQNMIALNTDRGLTAFVIGDTPFRLESNATALREWALGLNGPFDNGDVGAVSYNEYMAMYYPSGLTNDLTGKSIVVPPSHMMLRTYALSDQQSYQWFAPAGVRRGGVDNATSVGYVGSDGEFKLAPLPENIRNVMAQNGKINPIATLSGVGITAYGQYTRARAASSLDRVNVARLVCYLRRQLDLLSRPFLFEPNDKITRNEIKNAAQSLLLELVGQRAIYDFIVVCDESNNTPARIDRSELWMDIAIEPTKAVEFIYIPLRLVNTGAIQAGTFSLA